MIAARPNALVPVALGATLLALTTRPVASWSIAVVVGAGAVGLLVSVGRPVRVGPRVWVPVLLAGAAAFALFGLGTQHLPSVPSSVVVAVVAAAGEEAFFRRALYGRLEHLGPLLAVIGAAVAFAIVHVPVYGWAAAGVDLGAGLVLGWQRWATGRWGVPAATHAFANLVQVV